MPEFIPPTQIPLSLFQQRDIPSPVQSISDAISGVLAQKNQRDFQMRLMKAHAAATEKARLAYLDTVQEAMGARQKERDLTQTVRGLISKGYTTQPQPAPVEGAMPPGVEGPGRATLPPVAPGGIRFGPEVYNALGMQSPGGGAGLDFIPPKPKETDALTKQLKETDLLIKKQKLKQGAKKGGGDDLKRLLQARGQLVTQMNNAATDQATKDVLQSRVSALDESLGTAGLPGFDDELSSDLADAKEAVRLGKLKPEEAQARLQKKYPGLSPVFQSSGKGWLNTLLGAFGSEGD